MALQRGASGERSRPDILPRLQPDGERRLLVLQAVSEIGPQLAPAGKSRKPQPRTDVNLPGRLGALAGQADRPQGPPRLGGVHEERPPDPHSLHVPRPSAPLQAGVGQPPPEDFSVHDPVLEQRVRAQESAAAGPRARAWPEREWRSIRGDREAGPRKPVAAYETLGAPAREGVARLKRCRVARASPSRARSTQRQVVPGGADLEPGSQRKVGWRAVG